MLGTFLDLGSIDQADIDLSPLKHCLDAWHFHSETQSDQTYHRTANCDVIVTNKVSIDEKILTDHNSIKLVCVAATGVNNVDLNAARKNNVMVCNVRDYATASVVQHVFALILTLQSKLLTYRSAIQQGVWQSSTHFSFLDYPIHELAGKTIGIIGYGVLGKAVAHVAQAFSMNVLLWAREPDNSDQRRLPLEQLLAQSDIVSIHCPLTEQTRNLIDQQKLHYMKPNALLINTARGGIVDEHALLDALLHNKIAGAGVDVLTNEPPVDGNVLLGVDLPNLIVTPHIAWASVESRQRLIDEVVKNIEAFKQGGCRNRVV